MSVHQIYDEKEKKMSQKKQEVSYAQAAFLKFIERVAQLDEKKEQLAEEVKNLSAEINENGFDVPTIKTLVRCRKNSEKTKKKEQLLATYTAAVAIQFDLFGEATGELPIVH